MVYRGLGTPDTALGTGLHEAFPYADPAAASLVKELGPHATGTGIGFRAPAPERGDLGFHRML